MISIIKTIVSLLTPFLDKFLGRNSEKAQELKAEKELEELRAFKDGRITPHLLLLYVLVGIFGIGALLAILSFFFPQWLKTPDLTWLNEILRMGEGILE